MGMALKFVIAVAVSVISQCTIHCADGLFVSGPSDTTAIAGTTVTMSCELSQSWKHFSSVDWYVNGSPITSRRSKNDNGVHTLAIVGANKTDEGNYTCMFRGDNSSAGYLRVLQIPMPSFAAQPVGTKSLQNEAVVLECRVKDFDARYMEVYWRKGNHVVVKSGGQKKTQRSEEKSWYSFLEPDETGRYDLLIKRAECYDSGVFQCRVNLTGSGYILGSNTAVLTVLRPPRPQYPECGVRKPKPVHEETDDITTECRTKGGNTHVSLSWSKNNIIWNSSVVIDIQRNNYVYIRRTWTLSADDDGATITCIFEGDALLPSRSCSIGPLDVRFRPIVAVSPKVTELKPGESVSITCSALANPDVTEYRWLVNGQVIPNFDCNDFEIENKSTNESTLKIRNTGRRFGSVIKVVCEARNFGSYTSDNATILVEKSVTATDDVDSHVMHLPASISTAAVCASDETEPVVDGIAFTSSNVFIVLCFIVSCTTVIFILLVITIYFFNKKRNVRYSPQKERDNVLSLHGIGDLRTTALENEYVSHVHVRSPAPSEGISHDNEFEYFHLAIPTTTILRHSPGHDIGTSEGAQEHTDVREMSGHISTNQSSETPRFPADDVKVSGEARLQGGVNDHGNDNPQRRNVEGLVYADLGFVQNSGNHSKKTVRKRDSPVIYAKLQH